MGSRAIRGKINIKHTYVWYSAYPEKLMLQYKFFIMENDQIRLTQDIVPMPNSKFYKNYDKLIDSFKDKSKSDDEIEKEIYDYTMKIHKYFTKKFKYSSPIKLKELFTNKLVARNEYECEERVSGDNGLCSHSIYDDENNCEDNGGTWEDNNWENSDMNGKYFDGTVAGFSFQLFGMSVTGASGGLAEENGFIIDTQEESFAENGDAQPNILGYNLSGTTMSADAGVLTQIAFTDYEGGSICFTSTQGTCNTSYSNFVDIFSNQFGACVSSVGWGECHTP